MVEKDQTFTDSLAVFGDKSQAADNLEYLKDRIGSALTESVTTGDSMQDILGRTEFNIGADLGGGYELGVGVNTPSPMEDMIDDYRIKLTKRFEEGGRIKTILEEFKDKSQDADNVKATILDIVRLVDESKQLKDDKGWDFSSFLASPFAPEEGDIEINEDVENLKDLILAPKSYEEGGEVGGVDWNFISALEGGSQTEGYIPTKDDKVIGKSGLTIGTGWDVGQMSLKELESSGLPPKLIEKVKPFVGLKGKKALSKLEERGAPVLEDEEASIVDAFTHNKTLSQISKNYEKASGESFEDLSPAQQTVLASVGFQYGSNLKEATPGFWGQVTSGDWEGAQENLLDFGDKYGTRRGKEAELLEAETIARQLAEKGT